MSQIYFQRNYDCSGFIILQRERAAWEQDVVETLLLSKNGPINQIKGGWSNRLITAWKEQLLAYIIATTARIDYFWFSSKTNSTCNTFVTATKKCVDCKSISFVIMGLCKKIQQASQPHAHMQTIRRNLIWVGWELAHNSFTTSATNLVTELCHLQTKNNQMQLYFYR